MASYLSIYKPQSHCHGSDADSPRFLVNDLIVVKPVSYGKTTDNKGTRRVFLQLYTV